MTINLYEIEVMSINETLKEAATKNQSAGNILIVDDNQDILEALKEMLTIDGGYNIETADDIDSVKTRLKSFRPDIALLDIKLGNSNGLDLISILKLEFPDIDCIMMTAHHDTDYAVKALRYGAVEYLFKPLDPAQLLQTLMNFFQQRKIRQKEKKQEQNFKDMALHDPLTGLANRTLLYEHMENTIARSARNNQHFSILFIDLDNFKNINDSLGHQVGDEILKDVSKNLKASVRDGDVIARIGGDEFILVLGTEADRSTTGNFVKRLMSSISSMALQDVDENAFSVSIGIAIYPADGTDANTLLYNADSAMYKAKNMGKNCFQFYAPD